jgi:hypothetical protein
MIPRLTLLLLVGFSALLRVRAEDITVFGCVREQGGSVSMGDQLAVFTSGQKTLTTIYADYEEKSWRAEPFYGPVIPYIFKDSAGKLFVVHFEFQEGHELVGEGLRFAIAPLKPTSGSKRLYTGSPYHGSSVYDDGLVKQLRELSIKKKAPAK